MGRDTTRRRSEVAVDGDWFGVPYGFLASRACAELSPLACKMLFTLMGQLGTNHYGNGRIDAHPNTLRAYGWSGTASARAALKELEDSNLLVVTRRGHKGSVGLYAISLFPMHCKREGLTAGPGSWRVTDWRERSEKEAKPTKEKPATWNRPRKDEKQDRATRSGNESARYAPAAGMNHHATGPWIPAVGAQTAISGGNAFPQRVPPSREAICAERKGQAERIAAQHTLMGKLLAKRVPHTINPAYRLAVMRPKLAA